MNTPLQLESLGKRFHSDGREIAALAEVTLAIQPGKVTGLIGPDGAGKTTLMRCAAGILTPHAGHIEVLGIDAMRHPLKVQSSVGYMPQRFGLYEDLTVQENLDLYADLQGLPHRDRRQRYAALMNMTGLSPFTSRLAGKLSGGMKQKLGLACTLVKTPRLLLLDEPTVGVDPVSRRELWEIVYQQVTEGGMSVLLSTAYLDEAERCDEVILLHEGHKIMQGDPHTFSQQMRGRVFSIRLKQKDGSTSYRRLQQMLSQTPTVLDALVEGESIRLVMQADAGPPTPETLLPGVSGLHVESTEPKFEDVFVARLKPHTEQGTTGIDIQPRHAAGDDSVVIRTHNLQRRFGDFVAVRNISFSVNRGEIFGLLGANGAGKSTTFRMLCGLLPASAGELSVAGHNLRTASAESRTRIGYMAQKFSLYQNLSVLQNLRFFSSAYGLRGSAQQERIDWALETFELQPFRDVNAGTLPLGFKQRLSFAAALMHRPDILFLDEPTSGVDPLARREFWARTNALADAGVTVLVTTHFMEEANYCDRLVIMAEGEVLAEGTPRDMKQRARTSEHPDPTMEDAFIWLIEQREAARSTTGAAA
jgi:ABC-2 type transport system ATP-binding protein